MTDNIKRQPNGIPVAGQFASHDRAPGAALPSAAPGRSQADLAVAAYEPGTSNREKLELARTAIESHPDAFANMGEDVGESLEPFISDDAAVLKALDASGDAVGEYPSDFGQIIAEQINEDVNAAAEAEHRAGYAARPAAVETPGSDSTYDGAYDVRDPKHPGYEDRVTGDF